MYLFQEYDVIANFHVYCTVLVENMYIYIYTLYPIFLHQFVFIHIHLWVINSASKSE